MKLSHIIFLVTALSFAGTALFLKEKSQGFQTMKEGHSYTSSLVLRNEAEVNLPHLQAGAAGKLRVESESHLTIEEIPLQSVNGISRNLLRFSDASLSVLTNGQAKDLAPVYADLQKEFYLERDHEGQILTVKLPADLHPASLPILASLGYALQASLPAEPAESWMRLEQDTFGRFEQQYQRRDEDHQEVLIERQRTGAHKLQLKFGEDKVDTKTVGTFQLRYDRKASLLSSISGEEDIRFLNHLQRPLGFAKRKLKWKHRSVRPLLASEWGAIQARSLQSIEQAKPMNQVLAEKSASDIEVAYRNRLGNESLENIIQAIKTADRFEAIGDWSLKLNAFIALHPEKLKAFREELETSEPRSLFYQASIASLVSISTPAAQKILLSLLEKRQDQSEEAEILLGQLGFLSEPLAEVESSLQNFRQQEEYRQVSELSLANLSSRLEKDSDRRKVLENDLAGMLERAKTTAESEHALDVLGNLESAESLSLVQHALKHESASVRGKAAFALRSVRSEENRGKLLQILAKDPDADVRIQAALALHTQSLSQESFAEQARLVSEESHPRVRLQILENIGQGHYLDPVESKRILENALNDQDQNLQDRARSLLALFPSEKD